MVGRFWLFRDVTEHVGAEQRLRRVLDREQRARRLAEERTEQLKRLDQARTAFVSTVSHDFRTPLATILAAAGCSTAPARRTTASCAATSS